MWWLLLRFLPRPGLISYGVLAALVLLQLGGVDVLGIGLDLADQLAGDLLNWIEGVIADQLNPF
ncbi:hypothetical protein [Halobaculum gomorrense]|uniref:Uncharacterized protein n=1 Tax=Halobaculum gomorrense TaxID=43928 RepID=A0A1M5RCU0_9EURY|nr:hypothetical protein [Halobaculum gomorrense]SHH23859.1 hypothetical protein SAMN05443636_2136 [Halobaculum gomorrense]